MTQPRSIPAAGYVRRSTDLQERSIPDQKLAIERWAKDHGHHVVRWYVDDAVSGTSARGREQFELLMQAAENGRNFDVVLCYDMSRFSRGGTNETGFYLHRLRIAGVQTVFTAEGIPEGDEGELLQGVKSWQARQYSVKLSRDSIRGQHSTVTVRHSAMGGRAPYGYDRQYVTTSGQVLKTVRSLTDGRREEFGPDGRHLRYIEHNEKLAKKMKSDVVRLVPGDPAQVSVVRQIFRMSAKGYGFRSIVIALNEQGVPGPLGAKWNQMAIKTILMNPAYRGALAWNRRTFGKIHGVAADGSAIAKKVACSTRNPKDRWVVIEGVHEPLVSEDLFRQAHEQMAKRRNAGGLARPGQRYLLSGLLRCTHCGMNFWGCRVKKNGKDILYYADAGYRAQGPAVCKATHLPAPALDAWVLEQVRTTLFANPADTDRVIEKFVAAVGGQPEPDSGAAARELAAVNKRIQSTVALLTDSDLGDVQELRAGLVKLKKQREALEAAKKAAPEAPQRAEPATLRAWARERLAGLTEALKPGTPTMELRKAVHEFVDRIEVDPDRNVGTLYLPKDMLAALESMNVSRVRQASSSHSWTVASAERFASPSQSRNGVSYGLTIPMMSDTSSAISGSVSPPSYVALPVNAMVISLQARACVRLGTRERERNVQRAGQRPRRARR